MNEMLKRRRRYTEPETRFYLVQLIGACHYMHTHQVIHRDLKLGNIFLDQDMNIQVGDFGLAALIETPGDRKKWASIVIFITPRLNSLYCLGLFAGRQITSPLRFSLIPRMVIALKLISGPLVSSCS